MKIQIKLNDKEYKPLNIKNVLYKMLAVIWNRSVLGFLIIFTTISIFGKTEFLSWQMWVQCVMVGIGGGILKTDK